MTRIDRLTRSTFDLLAIAKLQKAEVRRRPEQGATLAELARSSDVGKITIFRLTG